MPIYDSYGREKVTTTGYELPLQYVSTTGSIDALPGVDGRPIFQVTGAIQIYAFIGHVTTTFDAPSTYMSASFVSRGGFSTGFSDDILVDYTEAGSLVDMVNGFNPSTFGHAHVRPNEVKVDYCPQGIINFSSALAPIGGLKFYLIYRPLTSGSIVVPVI